MKSKVVLLFNTTVFCLSLFQFSFSEEITKVLQNGLDDYEGWEDTYIITVGLEGQEQFQNDNFSEEKELFIAN